MNIRRAIALCLGTYTLLSLPGHENLWWIDVRPLPQWLLAIPGAVFCIHGALGRWPRAFTLAAATLMVVAIVNVLHFYALRLDAGVPVPFSAVVFALLILTLAAPPTRRPRLAAAVTVVALGLGLPLMQVFFFGRTSYARRADVIAVFGARCYADGRPSQSLVDRVRTGCRLYHEGLAPRLFLSGGPGDGTFHETDAMRDLALAEGVPAAAITLDRDGLSTWATVDHTGPGRVLAVSHFYHLPRIKLAYRRSGRTAYTVPADETYTVRQTPRLVMREVAAFWWYYLRSLT
ncbi:MAG: YdcF family protein [Planctomycetota bacterium]